MSEKSQYLEDVSADESYDQLPDDATIDETVENLEARGFDVVVVDDAEAALDAVIDQIPDDVSVMNGHSTTLEEIGFVDYLNEGDHDWENLSNEVWNIDDDAERHTFRREAQTADYFLGSVNAIAQSGELVAADASGSRIGAYPFAAQHLVLVSGVNKITDDLDAAFDRIEEFAYELENARAQEAYGMESVIAKQLVYRHETEEGRTTLVLVRDNLGY
ncbi:lactate utilization protein [Haloarchaeobius sp. HME9146]|uniref:lactate utilization protein n=1 Tax=Haloarchaeobius sp. HME9146 TaxID=2978732 RepID=UPI0021C19C47|nr:lactate utilization protein [Haloarchaeobius sp. HME9146]MCT9095521.1 lactate utilization protein [Haloarchaeobius sp. HME9146]